MRIIHGIKFEPELIREFHHVICQNIIKGKFSVSGSCWIMLIDFCVNFSGMQVLIDAREKLNIPWEHSHSHKAASLVMTYKSGYDLDLESFRHNAPIIHRLWQDRAIKKAFDRRREFQLVSAAWIIDSKCHQLTDKNSLWCFLCRVTQWVSSSTRSIG